MGKWLNIQRVGKRKGELKVSRLTRLNQLGKWFFDDPKELSMLLNNEEWDVFFFQLKDWIAERTLDVSLFVEYILYATMN